MCMKKTIEEQKKELKTMMTNVFRACPFPMGEFCETNVSAVMEDGRVQITAIVDNDCYLVIAKEKDKQSIMTRVMSIETVEKIFIDIFNNCGVNAIFNQFVKIA